MTTDPSTRSPLTSPRPPRNCARRLARPLLWLLALTLLAAGGLGCSATDDLDNFDVTVTGQTEVPGATPLEMLLGGFELTEDFTKFDLTEGQGFKNDKYDRSDVDSVFLERMTMTVVDPPDGQDLAFLGRVVFYAETDGLERIEIAHQDMFPEGEMSVDLEVTRDDLADYLLAPEGSITVEVMDSQRPPQRTTIEIEAVFDVDVNVI